MTDTPDNQDSPMGAPMGSLIDDEILSAPARAPRRTPRVIATIKAGAGGAWARPVVRRVLTAVCGVSLGLGAVGAYLVFRPVPQPDYDADALDRLFDYTLLTDEFNRLSVDERLVLLGQLRERLEGMGGNDSVLLAAFAARIKGELREQLMENMSRLGIDLADKYAASYNPRASVDEREAFLQASFIDLHKRMDTLGGSTRDMSDEDRLADGFKQAERDLEVIDSGAISGEQAGEIFGFMNDVVGKHASPHERARTSVFMRDMSRMLRGNPVGP